MERIVALAANASLTSTATMTAEITMGYEMLAGISSAMSAAKHSLDGSWDW